MYQYTIDINVSYGYGLKYWDTKNEPVSSRHGIQNLTVWPMAVCHNICAFVLYPLVSLSVPVYRCFLMFYMRRLLHQKQQLHRFVVPENRNMFQKFSEYTYWLFPQSIFPNMDTISNKFLQLVSEIFHWNLVSFQTFDLHVTPTQTNNAFWREFCSKVTIDCCFFDPSKRRFQPWRSSLRQRMRTNDEVRLLPKWRNP